MGIDMDWGWLRDNLPPGVEAGYDGMVLEIGDTSRQDRGTDGSG
jgi:hypothetical protein